jgi:hypothetical protein
MAARYEIKVKVSDELRQMDLQELVERATEYEGGAEKAQKIVERIEQGNRRSCNGCTTNSSIAALRVWIAKREMQGEERKGAA